MLQMREKLCQSAGMDKGFVIQTLREHQSELQEAGIAHLRLFGSVARGNATAKSDVDLIADIDRSRRLTLVKMARLENRLSDLLGVRVDLSISDSLKHSVRVRAAREAIHAF
jgi:uncharacterized protein